MRRVRVALAQVNPTVGAVEANARMVIDWMGRARAARRRRGRLPRAGAHRLSPRGSRLQARLHRGQPAGARATWPRGSRGLTAVVGFVDKRDDIFNAAAVLHDGAPRRHLSQAVPAELRCLRREPLLPGRHREPHLRGGRRGARHQYLRGHLVPDRAHHRPGPGRRRPRHQHQRLPVPRGQGAVPREDAGHARGRRSRVPRLRQHGGRAGRAGVRRPVLHLQREGRAGGARAAPSRRTSSSPTSSSTMSSAPASTTRAGARRSSGARARSAGSRSPPLPARARPPLPAPRASRGGPPRGDLPGAGGRASATTCARTGSVTW